MWADNETGIDLLGFEFLVDELEILLTEKRLLPVTVGVTGDWGSGKSSLMGMVRSRLEADEAARFICASFSPWRFEDYEDVKSALMATVISSLAERIEANEGLKERAGEKLNAVRRRLRDLGLIRHAATIGTAALGGGPEEAAAAGVAADAVAAAGADEKPEQELTFETVSQFHDEFEQLMLSLGDDVQALIVFIDDMDRCTTESIVDTFEAIRLFLHAPKTAYVIGAHAEIVEAALDGKYPARREGDEALGANYLEKMVQNETVIPPLSEPEAETYINLLFAELYAGPEQFEKLREVASEQRARNQLAVAMNEGIATEAIGELPEDLGRAFELAGRIGSPLARGLRGNPRQIKRFLNTLLLRQRTAAKRGMDLDPDKLAKLMVLEELHTSDFEQVFHWQLASDGAPEQLAIAERLARGEDVKEVPDEVEAWLLRPGIRDWLRLDPPLAGEALGAYFTFSRDKFTKGVQAARLPGALQELLVKLQSDLDPTRATAVTKVGELSDSERGELVPVLVSAAEGDLDGPAMKALIDIAESHDDVAEALFTGLGQVPTRRLKRNLVLRLGVKFKGDSRLAPLLDRWNEEGRQAVQRAVAEVRKG